MPAFPLPGATFVAVMAFYPIFASLDNAEYCADLFTVVAISLLFSFYLEDLTPCSVCRCCSIPRPARTARPMAGASAMHSGGC